jgi:hypothetical protein
MAFQSQAFERIILWVFMTRVIFVGFGVDPAADGQWVDPYQAYNMLVNADPKEKRIGPMAMFAFSSYFPAGLSFKYDFNIHGQVSLRLVCKENISPSLVHGFPRPRALANVSLSEWGIWQTNTFWVRNCLFQSLLSFAHFLQQEYPPGVFVAPMDSATLRPFTKTNLVVMAPTAPLQHPVDTTVAVACGDALICDPGCYPAAAQSQVFSLLMSFYALEHKPSPFSSCTE